MLDAATFSYDENAAALFDEQELVPEAASYLNSSYFDEIYHARTALEHIENVYPYEITHPPLGKLIIGIGIRLFGMTPFGWRFMGTLFGLLMLPILYDFIKRMSGSTKISVCGTVIFAFDFMHFVQTRIATIDTYSVFFILLMYLFMWRFVSGGKWRYLALSGLFFGLGAASKWTCVYAGGGLAVIWLLYWISRRREEGFWRDFISNCAFCLVFFVALPAAIYYASYYYYGTSKGLEGGLGMYFTKDYATSSCTTRSICGNTTPTSSRRTPIRAAGTSARGRAAHPLLSGILRRRYEERLRRLPEPRFLLGRAVCGHRLRRPRRQGQGLARGLHRHRLPGAVPTLGARDAPDLCLPLFPLGGLHGPGALPHVAALRDEGLYRWERPMYAFTGLGVLLFAAFYPVLTGVRTAVWYTRSFLKWFPSWPF